MHEEQQTSLEDEDLELPESFAWIAEAIRATVYRAWEIRAHYKLDPQRGSAVYEDLNARPADLDYAESALTAYSAAFTPVPGVENLLKAIADLLSSYNPFAITVLARGVIEWSARISYLFDRHLSSETRVARGWTEYMYSLWERRNTALLLNEEEAHRLTKRMEQEAKEAETFGFTVGLENKKRLKDRYFIGEPRKSSSDLIEDLYAPLGRGLGKLFWKYYSGFAHGTVHAFMEFYGKEPDLNPPGLTQAVKLSVEPRNIERAASLALIGYMESFARVVRCHGWEHSYWEVWCKAREPRLISLVTGQEES